MLATGRALAGGVRRLTTARVPLPRRRFRAPIHLCRQMGYQCLAGMPRRAAASSRIFALRCAAYSSMLISLISFGPADALEPSGLIGFGVRETSGDFGAASVAESLPISINCIGLGSAAMRAASFGFLPRW